MHKKFFMFTMIIACMGLYCPIGHAHQVYSEYSHIQNLKGFQGIAYSIADNLEHNLVHALNKARPILFTSFVELDNLQNTNSFGRLLGEQVASRIAQHGYRVVELKLRKESLIINENFGEAILSRSLDDVRDRQDAQAVIVGTYTWLDDAVIVSSRIISTLDGALLSTHDLTLRMNPQLDELLSKNPSVYRSGRPAQAETEDGPLGRGTILLDPKNTLAARLIQNRLSQLNYYTDRIDGIWGKNSRAALQRFKSERQLASPSAWDIQAQRELFRGTGQ